MKHLPFKRHVKYLVRQNELCSDIDLTLTSINSLLILNHDSYQKFP